MVKLKVVESLFEDLTIHTVLVSVSLVCLLPAEIDKHVFWVVMLDPVASIGHDSTDEGRVVADAHVVLNGMTDTLCFS